MSEGKTTEPKKFDVDEVISLMQASYNEHDNLPAPQRMDNNVRNNIGMITSKIHTWSKYRGATDGDIDTLAKAGLKKLKELYPEEEAFARVRSLLDENINEKNSESKQTGEKTISQKALERNMDVLSE